MPEHKLTLADLEAVEKAKKVADIGTLPRPYMVRDFTEYDDDTWDKNTGIFLALAANHAVEMKQALTEALEVIEAAQAQTGGTSMRLRMALKRFRGNWPNLISKAAL